MQHSIIKILLHGVNDTVSDLFLQKPFSEELALGTNNVPPAQPSESSDKNSLSKGSSIDETEIPS